MDELKKAPYHRLIAVSLMGGLMLSACATTQSPAPQRRPMDRPATQPQPPSGPEQTPAVDPESDIKDNSGAGETDPETPEPETEPEPEAEEPMVMDRGGITPPHMRGRNIKRLALLLPFSAKSARLRAEAQSMLKAAELATFDRDDADVVLVTLDTQGTSRGADAAAQAALAAGVDVILGPVLSGSVKSASRVASRKGVPVVAFSTDQTAAGRGTYLLSFPPEAEVKRIVDFAASTGITRFAYLGPQSEYGKRVNAAYQKAVAANGAQITASLTYDGDDITVMQAPAKELARQYREQDEATGGAGPMAFDAIILPEGGTPLRSLAPLLPYFYDGLAEVQFIGTGRWQNEETAKEPALENGIFAGPDEGARQAFISSYDRSYGEDPSRLASLAYDAINVGAVIADGDPRKRRARAEDPAGFYGADGLVRFNYDGTPDRGMAVFQIQNGRFAVIDAAPRRPDGPS